MSNILAEVMHSYTILSLSHPPPSNPPPLLLRYSESGLIHSIDVSLHQETFCQHLIKAPKLFQRSPFANTYRLDGDLISI